MSRPCQAEDSDGEECDCESFAPKAQKPKTCRRCLHTKKHHPEPDDTISSILLKVKQEHEGESGVEVFSKMADAKRESLNGMRPKKDLKLSGKDLKIPYKAGKPTRQGKAPVREPPSVATFKIDGIAILADGLVLGKGEKKKEARLVLADDGIPSKASLQVLINQGLAVRKDTAIEIAISATHEEMVDLISQHLPGPMVFFDQLGSTVFTDLSGAEVLSMPAWVILTRARQHLEVVEVVHPTGQDFHDNRVLTKNVTESRIIYLSSREPIPRAERETWQTTASLAFTRTKSQSPSVQVGSEKDEDTPKDVKKKKGRKKRQSSTAFNEIDDDSAEDTQPISKKPKGRDTRPYSDLPFIFQDDIAQELASSNAAFRPSNAVAGPSNYSNSLFNEPIDLTNTSRSPSPSLSSDWPAWAQGPRTPEHRTPVASNPDYSDPVEYNYFSGPKPLPKFF